MNLRVPLTLGLLLCLSAQLTDAQYLSRDFRRLWANQAFENYGAAGYRDYDLEEENRRFDLFGDPIIDGVDIIEYSELRRDMSGIRGSYEIRNARYERFFRKLVIANEGFGNWSTRLIIGDHIRTFFTPMTLNLPNYNGIRWDGASRKSRFSLVASHVRDPLTLGGGLSIDQSLEERRIWGGSLFGVHWESQIGDLLKLGTTYVNLHRFDAEASAKVNSLRGTVPGAMQGGLHKVFVFVTDDSPHDGRGGAAIHELTLNIDSTPVLPTRVGRIDNLIDKIPVTPDPTSTILLEPHEVDYIRRNRSWLKAAVDASRDRFFTSMIGRITTDITAEAATARGEPLRVNGSDVIYFEYEVPDTVSQLDFSAVLADDYSVDVVGAMLVPILASGDEDFYYDWYNAARAKGAPMGGANARRVNFRYGFPTGLTMAGLDWDLEAFGFHVQGEFARSMRFLQVPNRGAKRHRRESSTFYFNVSRPLYERASVGFEYFDMPDDYTTEFPLFLNQRTTKSVGGRLYTPFALVEDNDDLDFWPDRIEHNDPLAPFADPDASTFRFPGNGVYPGLDPDDDGVLDYNLDLEFGSDSAQPFLGYYSEPIGLVYGDDFDNNGVVDYRENDNLPDYAYPLDHRGFHAFSTANPSLRTEVRVGWYRVNQPVLGGENDTRYLEGQYGRDWPTLGYVRLNHRIKWVEDDIQNTVFNIGSNGSLRPDRLLNRDSVNNFTYFEAGLHALADLNIRNIITFSHVDLAGQPAADPSLAVPGTHIGLTMMNKIDYTWRRGRLKILPQFKHIFWRSESPERVVASSQRRQIMPILRAAYAITERSDIKLGMQGFPFWRESVTQAATPEGDSSRLTYTALIQNRSNYLGYDLVMLMGTYRTTTRYPGIDRPNSGFIEYFFRVFIG
ncbi:MAG: hypothetical protein VX733_05135 [Candidatus Latescibacterota bacterium]|nr:hypothetical protein [Candidatus Latescibacterota bacterium]